MNFKTFVNELDLSYLTIGWKICRNDWAGLAKYLVEKLSKLLKKANPDDLRKYSVLVAKIAVYVQQGIATFCPDDSAYKAAGVTTCNAIARLAVHLEDGEYTTDELDEDIDNITKCIDAWKAVK